MYTTKQQKPQQSRVLQNSKSLRCFALQRNTIVFEQKEQTYDWLYGRTNVGKIVRVGLDPDNMIQGQSANLNVAQDAMMCQIRKLWGIKGGNLVKGHLWNDNLGGSALNSNLFPITKAANSDHLYTVENVAKDYIYNRKRPIYYQVEVIANPNILSPKANFVCEIREWDPLTPFLIGNLLHGPVMVSSNLLNVGAYGKARVLNSWSKAKLYASPRKPWWIKNPKKKVYELTKPELRRRNGEK